MKKLLLTLFTVLISCSAWAQTSELGASYLYNNFINPDERIAGSEVNVTTNVASTDYVSGVWNGNELINEPFSFLYVPAASSVNSKKGFYIGNKMEGIYDIYVVTMPIWFYQKETDGLEITNKKAYKYRVYIWEQDAEGHYPANGVMMHDKEDRNVYSTPEPSSIDIIRDTTFIGTYDFKVFPYYREGVDPNPIIQICNYVTKSESEEYSYDIMLSGIILKPHEGVEEKQVEIDGIKYNLNSESNTAQVIKSKGYFGNIKIPSLIMHEGTNYDVNSIGICAFEGCENLTSIDIPNSITEICSGAFSGCSGLTSVIIPDKVNVVSNAAFSGCTGLTSIDIPRNIVKIESCAFRNCTGLTSLVIPNSVTSIGENAFSNCTNLISVDIPNSVSKADLKQFRGCTKIESITTDCEYAGSWYELESLKSVTLGEGVKYMGSFGNCRGLISVKVKWNRPLAMDYYYTIFQNVNLSACTLYVPKGTAMMYMSATGWNKFGNIVEYEDGDAAHYITIRMGDGGELQQSVELGKIYIYKVKADEGWNVNTLTFNGQDMTGQLLDGQFSTPVITGDAELNVVFKQEASNIKSMKQTETSKVKVYAYNGTIKVAGAEDDAKVEVYNTGGIRIAEGEGNCSISLDSGIYIVKVGKETFKVSL